MLHFKRVLGKAEKEAYRKWLAKHKASLTKVSKDVSAARAKTYWEKQAAAIAMVKTIRSPGEPEYPSGPSEPPIGIIVAHLIGEESNEMLERERRAQEEILRKKRAVAPAYNKGGDVYWTEEMAKDFAAGGQRRR